MCWKDLSSCLQVQHHCKICQYSNNIPTCLSYANMPMCWEIFPRVSRYNVMGEICEFANYMPVICKEYTNNMSICRENTCSMPMCRGKRVLVSPGTKSHTYWKCGVCIRVWYQASKIWYIESRLKLKPYTYAYVKCNDILVAHAYILFMPHLCVYPRKKKILKCFCFLTVGQRACR